MANIFSIKIDCSVLSEYEDHHEFDGMRAFIRQEFFQSLKDIQESTHKNYGVIVDFVGKDV